jgi:hypothetical protein
MTKKSRKSLSQAQFGPTIVQSDNNRVMTFPEKGRFKMRYADSFSLVTTTVPSSQVMNLNSLYDPDSTGTGHQPRYFDTLVGATGGAQPYSQYRVLSCRWIVKFNTVASNTTAFVAARVRNNNGSISSFSSSQQYAEWPHTQYTTLTGAGGLGGMCTMEKTVNMASASGKLLRDSTLSAAYNASPANLIQLELSSIAYDSTTSLTVNVYVELIFDCELFDLNEPTVSAKPPRVIHTIAPGEQYDQPSALLSPSLASSGEKTSVPTGGGETSFAHTRVVEIAPTVKNQACSCEKCQKGRA